MSTNIQAFSPELCAHLSFLAPGFEGHWKYVKTDDGISIRCEDDLHWLDSELSTIYPVICPAWQVEDVLRNRIAIFGELMVGPAKVVTLFLENPNTAYQKIEEYLWQILWINKEVLCCGGLGSITKGECGRGTKTGCVGMHCKCMQKDCSNMHYVDCREHYIHVEYLEK